MSPVVRVPGHDYHIGPGEVQDPAGKLVRGTVRMEEASDVFAGMEPRALRACG